MLRSKVTTAESQISQTKMRVAKIEAEYRMWEKKHQQLNLHAKIDYTS